MSIVSQAIEELSEITKGLNQLLQQSTANTQAQGSEAAAAAQSDSSTPTLQADKEIASSAEGQRNVYNS